MEKLCINCKKNPIYIKKRGLCKLCYPRLRKSGELEIKGKATPINKWNIAHQAEIEFIKIFFEHNNWLYHPAIFRFNGNRYEPDFYDGERNVFIEVAGTSQAFYANLSKYKIFIETFPHINFEVRYKSGTLVDLEKGAFHKNI